MGVAVKLFWAAQSWRRGGLNEFSAVIAPILIALAISFLLFALWPWRFEREIGLWWNASLWPASIPVGFGSTAAWIKREEIKYSLGASPCLSPYVLLHSGVAALLALSSSLIYSAVAVAGLWIVVVIRPSVVKRFRLKFAGQL